jgi:hypothetical protein
MTAPDHKAATVKQSLTVDEAIAVFDKSASRTTPNAQTEAWTVIRAELEKLRQRCEELEEENERASALARQIKTDWMPANERISGELKLAREDARTLAASVHGAFKALGSAPPEPILKVANRHFPLPRKARRTKRAAIDRAGGGEETK